MAIHKTYKGDKNGRYKFRVHCSGQGGCPHIHEDKTTGNFIIWNPDDEKQKVVFTREEMTYLVKHAKEGNII